MNSRFAQCIFAVLVWCITSGSGAFAAAKGNLIMNGGFENGIQFWKGDGKIVTLPDTNKVFELDASKSRMKDLSQDFAMQELQELEIVFRARSIKYNGPGIRISVHMPGGGSILYNKKLPEDGSWADLRVHYTRTTPNQDRRTLVIATLLGTGQVQIDDVEVRAPSTTVAETSPAPPPAPAPKPAATPAPMPPVVSVKPVPAPPPPVKPMTPDKPAAAATDTPGSFPPKYREVAEDLMKTVWDWKASGGNYNGVTVFEANGDGIETDKTTGDWRIAEDGTLVYRRGDDRSLIWHLQRVDADHFAGEGVGGAARNRTCSLTRKNAR